MSVNQKEAALIFKDKDIATIEAMHDLLLDHGHGINERALRESRGLTQRMYEAMKYSSDTFSDIRDRQIDEMAKDYGE